MKQRSRFILPLLLLFPFYTHSSGEFAHTLISFVKPYLPSVGKILSTAAIGNAMNRGHNTHDPFNDGFSHHGSHLSTTPSDVGGNITTTQSKSSSSEKTHREQESERALEQWKEQYKEETVEQLQAHIESEQGIIKSAKGEVEYRKSRNDKEATKYAEEQLQFWQQNVENIKAEIARKTQHTSEEKTKVATPSDPAKTGEWVNFDNEQLAAYEAKMIKNHESNKKFVENGPRTPTRIAAEQQLKKTEQLLTNIKDERMSRLKKQATTTGATYLVAKTQTAGTESTEKAQTVSDEEKRLYDSIKAREAQSYKWKNSIWPSDWNVSLYEANEYEKETNVEKQKLAAIQSKRWGNAKEAHTKHEGEKFKENAKKVTEGRNNSGGNGGDNDPNNNKKDPKKPLKDTAGTAAIKSGKEEAINKQQNDSKQARQEGKPQKQQKARNENFSQKRQANTGEATTPPHEKGIEGEFYEQVDKVKHNFRDKPGHFRERTPGAEKAVKDSIKKEHYRGEDQYNNHYYDYIDDKGNQVWAEVRPDGKIKNCGVNETHWKPNAEGFLERPAEAINDNSQLYSVIGGGLSAIAASSDTEATEIRANIQKAIDIPKLPDAPKVSQEERYMRDNDELRKAGLPTIPLTPVDQVQKSKDHFSIVSSKEQSRHDQLSFTKGKDYATTNPREFYKIAKEYTPKPKSSETTGWGDTVGWGNDSSWNAPSSWKSSKSGKSGKKGNSSEFVDSLTKYMPKPGTKKD